MYSLTSNEFGKESHLIINKIFKSGFLTMGRHVEEFENNLRIFHNRKYAIMTNSGSSANLLMIASLVLSGKLKKGDQIIVPSVSWSTTYFPLTQYGLIPYFVDVDRDTYSLNHSDLEKLINNKKIKAVLFVSLLGNYRDAEKIKKLCAAKKKIFLEDCCEAFGSNNNSKKNIAGKNGFISTLSFFYSHQLPGIEGGCILTDDKKIYDYCLSLRAHGWTRDIKGKTTLPIEKDDFKRKFRFVLPGYCLRPIEFTAALANERLKKWSDTESIRKKNLEIFHDLFDRINGLTTQHFHPGMSAFGFGILLSNKIRRDNLVKTLESNKIECRPIVAGNFTLNPVMQYMKSKISKNLINANLIENYGMFFGNHRKNLSKELKITSKIIKAYLEENI